MTRLRVLAAVLLLGFVAACGGSTKAMVPVDSPILKWKEPTEEELTGQANKAEGDDGWGEAAEEEVPPEPAPAPDKK